MEDAIERIRERAIVRRRRNLVVAGGAIVFVGVAACLVANAVQGDGSRLLSRVILLAVVAVIGWSLVYLLVRTNERSTTSAWRPLLALGLDRGQRRAVRRDLRRRTPNDDALLREIEVHTVRRFVPRRRWSVWLNPVLVVIWIAYAVVAEDLFGRVLGVGLAASWTWISVAAVTQVRRQRTFLAD